MKKVKIGLGPANFLHITMVDYTFTTQGSIKKLFQGLCKDKICIKTILIILIQVCHHTYNNATSS